MFGESEVVEKGRREPRRVRVTGGELSPKRGRSRGVVGLGSHGFRKGIHPETLVPQCPSGPGAGIPTETEVGGVGSSVIVVGVKCRPFFYFVTLFSWTDVRVSTLHRLGPALGEELGCRDGVLGDRGRFTESLLELCLPTPSPTVPEEPLLDWSWSGPVREGRGEGTWDGPCEYRWSSPHPSSSPVRLDS